MTLINEIEQQIKQLKSTLKELKIQEQTKFLSFDELNVVRPYIQLLKAWNEGYSKNRQKSWNQYLVEAAKPIQKTWKTNLDKEPEQLSFWILRYEFVNLYKRYSHLFLDKNNKVIPKPPSGPRVNGSFVELKEVLIWKCDNKDCKWIGPVPKFKIHNEEDYLYKRHLYLMTQATIYDRYFCPDYKSCGGVLIPQLIS